MVCVQLSEDSAASAVDSELGVLPKLLLVAVLIDLKKVVSSLQLSQHTLLLFSLTLSK